MPSRPSSASAPMALLLMACVTMVMAQRASAAAESRYDYGDGVCLVRINARGVGEAVPGAGDPRCEQKRFPRGSRLGKIDGSNSSSSSSSNEGRKTVDLDFDRPAAAAIAAAAPSGPPTLTVALEAGSDRASPQGAYYTVTWSGIAGALTSDRIVVLIGRVSQSNPDKDSLHPRSYFFAPEVAPSSWLATGSGSVRVFLPLLRESVTIAYVQRDASTANFNGNLWRNFNSLAQVYLDPPTSDPPHNVRLSIVPTAAGALGKAAAIWQQRSTITGATVRWRPFDGTYGGTGSGSAAATASIYSKGQMCQEPASSPGWISPGQVYRGDLSNLANAKRYAYQVGSDAAGWSAERSFVTPPSASDATATTRMLITADSGKYSPDYARVPDGNSFATQRVLSGSTMTPGTADFTSTQAVLQAVGLGPGQQPGSRGVVKGMAALLDAAESDNSVIAPHLVINNGDLSYARGEAHQWDLWGTQFLDRVASRAITMYSVGNHEGDGPGAPDSPFNGTTDIDSGGECTVPTRRLLQMAQPSGPTSDWFSADVGPIHFVQLNSEQQLRSGSRQRAWLEADLSKVNRTKTPWLIVGMHRPVLVDSNDSGDQASATTIRNSIEPLLVKYEVDVVLAGHIHSGQRSCVGVIKGRCVGKNADGTAKGPTYILTGQGGFQSPLNAFATKPAWEDWASWAYGFAEARATRTTLTIDSYASPSSGALTTLDTVTLTKPQGWVPNRILAVRRYAFAFGAWVVPPTISQSKLTATLTANLVAASKINDDWTNKYLSPAGNTDFWRVLNGLPGKDGNDYTIKQVWQAAYPLYSLINTGTYSWVSPLITDDIKYVWALIQPGGRMYYGP